MVDSYAVFDSCTKWLGRVATGPVFCMEGLDE